MRFLSPARPRRILSRLAGSADEIGAAHEVSLAFTIGSTVPPVTRAVRRAAGPRVVARGAGAAGRLEIEADRGGISFPNYVEDPTRCAIVDGLGPVGDGMHTRDERLDLRSLERRMLLLADLLDTF